MKTELEQTIMLLIMNGGNARSLSLQAIQAAEKSDFGEADKLLKQAKEAINQVHELQSSLIRKEAKGKQTDTNLLMVHAQDHVMNAITIKELAAHIINNRKEIEALKRLK